MGANMNPQFQPGQMVRLARGLLNRGTGGDYKVVRQVPYDGIEPQYRIKSDREPHERIAKGCELEEA
jgi:hypothetical protein